MISTRKSSQSHHLLPCQIGVIQSRVVISTDCPSNRSHRHTYHIKLLAVDAVPAGCDSIIVRVACSRNYTRRNIARRHSKRVLFLSHCFCVFLLSCTSTSADGRLYPRLLRRCDAILLCLSQTLLQLHRMERVIKREQQAFSF